MKLARQVSVLVPVEVLREAERKAKRTKREDGLKQTVSAQLRDWIIVGKKCEETHAS